MKNHFYNKSGFTIIEVSLAMTFLSVLLITVTFLTIHITTIYQKGLSIKAITSTGRELVDEFSRAVASASGIDAKALCDNHYKNKEDDKIKKQCQDDNGRRFIYQVRYAKPSDLNLNLRRDDTDYVAASGVFCSGHYSYLWNSGYVVNNNNSKAKGYSAKLMDNSTNTSYDNFRLLKVVDINRSLCSTHMPNTSYEYDNINASTDNNNRTYSSSSIGTVEEILTSSEDNLALYSLDIFEPATHKITRHAFYSGSFILATIQGGIDITAQGDYCSDSASTDLNTDFNYCAINKFNFAMRATGETKS